MKKLVKFLISSALSIIKSPKNLTYEGIYATFEEVNEIYKLRGEYATELQFSDSKVKANALVNYFRSGEINRPDWETQRLNFLSIFVSGIVCKKLSILDIGGGFAETFLHLKATTQKLDVNYEIIELQNTVESSRKIFGNFKELQFSSSLEELDFQPDIVYFGSSLQYFEDYRNVLTEVISLNPDYIVITDTPMGTMNTFVCAQVNMKDIVIPRLVFCLEELLEIFKTQGFDLIHKSYMYYPFHNFDNYNPPYSNSLHTNLIFGNCNRT